jgi:tetratricopeptide (TPR) repeat protein
MKYSIDPQLIGSLLKKADLHWQAGQASQAEQCCQQVLAIWPGQPDALHILGLIAHAYGRLDQAISLLKQAIMSPRAPASYLSNLAEMYRLKGNLAEAELYARQAVVIEPNLAAAHSNLGIILQEAGKWDESLKALRVSLQLNPESAKIYNNLANTCVLQGRLEDAIGYYQKALEMFPDYTEGYSNAAVANFRLGRVEEAFSLLQQALDQDPSFVPAYGNRVDFYLAQSNIPAAQQTLLMMEGFAPNHPLTQQCRSKLQVIDSVA